MSPSIIDSDFLEQLERFVLTSRRVHPGLRIRTGSHMRRGLSSEFFAHRPYTSGDDLRYVDWKVYGRLERLFLKLFRQEEELDVHLLLDTSASMSIGQPPKLDLAARLAMALALTGLVNHQRVGLALFNSSTMLVIPPGRGRKHRRYLFQVISDCTPEGEANLADSLHVYAGHCRRGGLAILLSDMLCQGMMERELAHLQSKKLDLFLIQILAREEIDPVIEEPVSLFDVESGKRVEMEEPLRQLELYKKKLKDFNENLKFSCDVRNIEICQLVNDEPLHRVILSLARYGLLRKR